MLNKTKFASTSLALALTAFCSQNSFATEINHETDERQSHSSMFLASCDTSNPRHVEELNRILDAQIELQEEATTHLKPTFGKMEQWWKGYVANEEFLSIYPDSRSIKVTAEATFWSVQLGLDEYFKEMSYGQIRQFHPFEEVMEESPLGKKIENVFAKLNTSSMSHEASYGVQQAAWSVYAQYNSYSKFEEEGELYDSNSR